MDGAGVLVRVRNRQQLAVAGAAQRKPALLGLAVRRIKHGQRQSINQHCGLHKCDALVLGDI